MPTSKRILSELVPQREGWMELVIGIVRSRAQTRARAFGVVTMV